MSFSLFFAASGDSGIQEIPNVLGFSTIWGFVEILIFGKFEKSKAAVYVRVCECVCVCVCVSVCVCLCGIQSPDRG